MRKILRLSSAVMLMVAALCGPGAADDFQTCTKEDGVVAIDACTRAIRSGRYKGSNLAVLYINRGAVWRDDMKDLDKALADYSEALSIDGKQPTIYNNRAKIWYDRGDYERAISDYDRAIALDKLYTAAYTNRGRAYEKKSDVTRARADYNSALSVPAKFNDGQWAHDTARERLKALDSSQ